MIQIPCILGMLSLVLAERNEAAARGGATMQSGAEALVNGLLEEMAQLRRQHAELSAQNEALTKKLESSQKSWQDSAALALVSAHASMSPDGPDMDVNLPPRSRLVPGDIDLSGFPCPKGAHARSHVDFLEGNQTLISKTPVKVFTIALTGGPCGGKSSILQGLASSVSAQGFDVYLVPEVPTILQTHGCKFPVHGTETEKFTYDLNVVILRRQLEDEVHEAVAHKEGTKAVIFVDRGLLDSKAFVSNSQWEQILSKTGLTEEAILGRYDGLIHLVTAANGAAQFYRWSGDNKGPITDDSGTVVERWETPEKAIEKDDALQKYWEKHPKRFIAYNVEGGIEKKLADSIKWITNLLGS